MARPYSPGGGGAPPHSDRARRALARLEATVPISTLPLRDGRYLRHLGGDTWLVAATAVPDAPVAPLERDEAPTLLTGAQLLVRRVAVGWSRTRLSEAARCSWSALRRLEDQDRGGSALRERLADALAAAQAEADTPREEDRR